MNLDSADQRAVDPFDRGPATNFADLVAHATQCGTSVLITFDRNDVITLEHARLGSLHASDFLSSEQPRQATGTTFRSDCGAADTAVETIAVDVATAIIRTIAVRVKLLSLICIFRLHLFVSSHSCCALHL